VAHNVGVLAATQKIKINHTHKNIMKYRKIQIQRKEVQANSNRKRRQPQRVPVLVIKTDPC
jgi:hypothetical protein